MKSSKMNIPSRMLSFFLIVFLLICVVTFATVGLQDDPETKPDDSGNVADEDNTNDETDENTNGNTNGNNNQTPPPQDDNQTNPPIDTTPDTPVIETPKYYSPMTGLEVTAETLATTPLGFVLNPKYPLYGVSNSDITFEFPTEKNDTRLLSYTTDYSMLWKVGSLAPTRAFISNTSNFIGGIVVCYGSDDIVKYSVWDATRVTLDISKITNAFYVENTYYIYTNNDMVDAAKNTAISYLQPTQYKGIPYKFSEDTVLGTTSAKTVILPYSETNETELYYSESSGQYLYFKSGTRKVDMLNGKNLSFTNLFVLFADTTTYEKASGTELVVDTVAGGSGYYISKGFLTEIKWSTNEAGNLEFTTLNGDILSVNPGNSYVGYFKSSNTELITVG